MDTQWLWVSLLAEGYSDPMLQCGWTLKTLSHEDTYSQEEIVHESTSSSVHGEKTWKTSQDRRTCSPQGDRCTANQQWDCISHLPDCKNPGLPVPGDGAWSSVRCHMSFVMCEEATPYRLFWRTVWQYLEDVEKDTPLCQHPLPGTYSRDFLTLVGGIMHKVFLYHCSYWGKSETILNTSARMKGKQIVIKQ